MKIKLTASTIWTVRPKDEGTAQSVADKPKRHVIISYITDAMASPLEFSAPEVSAEILPEEEKEGQLKEGA